MSTLLLDLDNGTLQQEEVEMLEHPLVAGVILFSRNFQDTEQLQKLTYDIRNKVKKTLLITVDQEGGRVQRFREGFTQLPAMQAFDLLLNTEEEKECALKQAGQTMANEIFAMDIDHSFVPSLDLGHISKAIGDRSLGENPKRVAQLARHYIRGLHQVGMAATGKHFPGHGHTTTDSHLSTPIDNRSFNDIYQHDMQPFIELINDGLLAGMMPAHVVFPECDSQPASGSSYWLKDILRDKLGFKGLVFSDDLGMQGAGFMGDYVERCTQAKAAGCDILLLCNNRPGFIEVLDNFKPVDNPAVKPRLHRFFKQKQINWQELQQDANYQQNRQQLSELQQRWLEYKDKHFS